MYNYQITILILYFSLFGLIQVNAQEVVINEIMSDNNDTYLDDDGEYSDWIELYNYGASTIELQGFHLSDDKENLQKWTFPKLEMKPGEFLVVFASGKDKLGLGEIHTNFKISSEGEKLFFSNNQNILIDQFEKTELKEDESFGRLPDGSSNILKLPAPSPNETNNGLNKLIFSHEPGFYDLPLNLSIQSVLGDQIYYTIDGSEPSPQSILYDADLLLNDASSNPNVWSEIPTTPAKELISNPAWQSPGALVSKANIIRCASFKNNTKTSLTYTSSYLIASDVFDRYDMPVISLITEGDHFFGHDQGIYVPGAEYNPDNPEWTGNYFTDEVESERPIHIELFETDGKLGLSQNAGVRIHGGKTRHGAQKSLRLYARTSYGEKYFNYPLMPQNNVKKYKRFLLQTTMASWGGDSVIKDILAHEIVENMDIETMDYKPAIVFLNGEYWGIHHIRDRLDEEYLSYTTGLELDSIEIDRSGNNHFNAVGDYIKSHIPIDNAELEYISTQMDIPSYIDYQIAEMFLKNYDWPANNSRHWRPKTVDGKWRWIFFDIDGGFGDYNYNMLVHNTNIDSTVGWPNNPRSTFLFRSLIENRFFLYQYLARYKEMLENDFRFSVTKEKLASLINEYKTELPHHIDRWQYPTTMNKWMDDIDNDIVDFLKHRPCVVVDNLINFFSLQKYKVECLDILDNVNQSDIIVDFQLFPSPNNGNFSIKNNSKNTRTIELSFINSLGQVVCQNQQLLIHGSTSKTVDKSFLPSGIYYLNLMEADTMITFRLIIAK